MDSKKGQLLKTLVILFAFGVSFSQDYDYPVYSKDNLPTTSFSALNKVIKKDYDYPMYSEDDMPTTSFSCKDKVNGGYYADIETDCQMYHVCSKNKFGFLRSTRFLCGNGTVFDQRHLVCEDYKKVQNCRNSAKYYRNTASILEYLEARLRSEKRDKEILEASQFDSDYDYSTDDNLPITSFSCKDKMNGGYYADIETDCQMYHVCSKNKFGVLRSTRFLCGNGTVFDQRHLVCQDERRVQHCSDSAKYYRKPAIRILRTFYDLSKVARRH